MATPKTPKGWTVELLGLIGAVEFRNGGRSLLWCDGQWTQSRRGHDGRTVTTSAPGIPRAGNVKDARRIGCEFLAEFEQAAA